MYPFFNLCQVFSSGGALILCITQSYYVPILGKPTDIDPAIEFGKLDEKPTDSLMEKQAQRIKQIMEDQQQQFLSKLTNNNPQTTTESLRAESNENLDEIKCKELLKKRKIADGQTHLTNVTNANGTYITRKPPIKTSNSVKTPIEYVLEPVILRKVSFDNGKTSYYYHTYKNVPRVTPEEPAEAPINSPNLAWKKSLMKNSLKFVVPLRYPVENWKSLRPIPYYGSKYDQPTYLEVSPYMIKTLEIPNQYASKES